VLIIVDYVSGSYFRESTVTIAAIEKVAFNESRKGTIVNIDIQITVVIVVDYARVK